MLLTQMKRKNTGISRPITSETELPIRVINEVLISSKLASEFLKSLSHEGRLAILCHLAGGEKTVSEITDFLDGKQASISQQLARLRLEGIVKSRRDGRNIFYSINDPKTIQLIKLLHTLFCPHGSIYRRSG